ncbi:MAG: PEP-CTERM sorting domain-containing protein [Limisphaerales bacterium]
MKKLLIAVLTAGTFTVEAQLTMNAGDTFVYHFDTLQFMGSGILPPPAGLFNLAFDASTVDAEDSLRMELFEGLASGGPVAERTITPGADLPYLESGSAWIDHEGSIRLTALAGQFTIDQIFIVRRDLTPTAIEAYGVTVVPEPSTAAVAALGVVLLAGWRWRKAA